VQYDFQSEFAKSKFITQDFKNIVALLLIFIKVRLFGRTETLPNKYSKSWFAVKQMYGIIIRAVKAFINFKKSNDNHKKNLLSYSFTCYHNNSGRVPYPYAKKDKRAG
jgi:uncharacterized membrane protein SirB2